MVFDKKHQTSIEKGLSEKCKSFRFTLFGQSLNPYSSVFDGSSFLIRANANSYASFP